jgi:hypothetical protein
MFASHSHVCTFRVHVQAFTVAKELLRQAEALLAKFREIGGDDTSIALFWVYDVVLRDYRPAKEGDEFWWIVCEHFPLYVWFLFVCVLFHLPHDSVLWCVRWALNIALNKYGNARCVTYVQMERIMAAANVPQIGALYVDISPIADQPDAPREVPIELQQQVFDLSSGTGVSVWLATGKAANLDTASCTRLFVTPHILTATWCPTVCKAMVLGLDPTSNVTMKDCEAMAVQAIRDVFGFCFGCLLVLRYLLAFI